MPDSRQHLPEAYLWLRPPPSVREALARHREAWWWPRSPHLPAAGRLHLTLHALGRLTDDELAEVDRCLRGCRPPRFDLTLSWSGVRGDLALACPAPSPPLQRLYAQSHVGLPAWVARRRSPWRPHLTLAWQAHGAAADALAPILWPVDAFALVRSWLPPHAARHEELARYRLEGAAA